MARAGSGGLLVTADHELRESAALALRKKGYRVSRRPRGHAVLACMEAGRIESPRSAIDGRRLRAGAAERLRRRCPELRSLYSARAGTPECEGILVRPFTR